MIEQTTSMAHRLSRLLAWIGGGMLLGASALVTVDVLARRLFNTTLGGADEITGYCFAVGTSLSLAFALFERAHIRIDAAYQFMPTRIRITLDIIGVAALTGFTALIAWMGWGLVADTLQYNSRSITPLNVPLAIPQIPWLMGWFFAVVAGVLLLITA
ncbi:MAG: TRAP transporter small permease, partial [Pseudomonadota bacterium]